MTMPPAPGQGLGVVVANIPQKAYEKAVDDVSDEMADLFKFYCEELEKAVKLPEAPDYVALAMYRSPTYQWQALEAEFPQAFEEEFARWDKLEGKALKDADLEAKAQAQMMLMAAQTQPPPPPTAAPPAPTPPKEL